MQKRKEQARESGEGKQAKGAGFLLPRPLGGLAADGVAQMKGGSSRLKIQIESGSLHFGLIKKLSLAVTQQPLGL